MSTSTKKKIVYPRIMRHGNRGVIVKFTALKHGTDWYMQDFKETDDVIKLCSKESGVLL